MGCALLGLPGAALAGPGTGLTAEGVAHKAAVIDRGLALHGFLPPPPGEGRGEGATFAHAAAVPSSPALLPEGEGSRALDATPAARQAAVIDQGPTRHGFLPPPPGEGRGEGASFAHATAAPSSPALLPEGEGSRALRCLGGFEIAALAGAYIACAQAGLPALVDGFITTAAALAACRIHPGVRDWLLFSHAGSEPGHARLLAALEAKPLLQLDLRLGEGSGAAVALPLLRLACALHKGMATFAEANISNAP
ncbi:MAG: nicotinate-nucleotide--dimethylbenzimidazole phosphoribosyltransferase [Betaproteobacteria bacterium]|nr:nicotinate-nucleotide--dimethylbenzimidazole phosphoribosyltransferase [Betaproteobacteria bacterium]